MKLVIVLSVFLLSSCVSFGETSTMNTVTYKQIKDQKLDADIWTPNENKPNYPVVFLVHGGSWSSRDRSDMNKISKKLSKNGFAVVNISYRFAPAAIFPAQIDDLKAAVSWAKENSKKYKLDTTRINFWGYSAGSEISTLTALQINDQTKVRAIINGAGPMDLTKYPDDPAIIQYVGTNNFESLKKASPIFFVKTNSPPVFTYHSTNDKIVYFEHATRFHEELNKKNVENEIHSVPVLGHIMTFLVSGESVDKSIDFLKKHN